MAKTPIYAPNEFVSALNSDTNKIYNGLTVSQIFDLYGVIFKSLPGGRVNGLCRAAKSEEKVSGYINVNIGFNEWYYLSKYALDNINSSAYYQHLASITLGVYSLKSSAISNIWDGNSNVISNRVPLGTFPVFDVFEKNIFNTTISSGTTTFTANFPPSLSGETCTLVLKNMSSDSVVASQEFTIGESGRSSVAITLSAGTIGDKYSFNINSLTIFDDKVDYLGKLNRTINSSFIQNNMYTPYLVYS